MADKTGYIGRSPSDSTTIIARQSFSVGISTDSFSFNSGYTPGYVDVYINGVKLIDVSDFSATDGSNITLLTAANIGDVVEVVAYKAFNIGSISDTPGNFNVGNVLTAQSGSVTGNFTVGGVLTYEDVNNVDSIGVITARTGVDVLAGGVDITGGGLKVVGVTSLTGNTVVSNNADVTISSGSSVTTAEHFYFDDGKKANFGNDSDLQIYHNDTSGYIDNNKGALYIRNNVDNDDGGNIVIEAKSGESAAVFQDDEGVRLYYDGVEKFTTTGGGVDVTGITTSDGFYATGVGVGTALFVDGDARVTGLRIDSTVGVGTALFVEGDARVTGILTVGTASVTLNGTTGTITGASLTNAKVAGISSEITDTAVDVFVYDTSKDSDGGAWRKRTQHTSWYNETLGTATRGTRKEFPSVAVISYGSGFINIYDGDDPDLPMWMTFDSGSFATFVTDIPTSISMLNGVLVWACKNTNSAFAQNNLVICNFISEKTERISHAGNTYSGTDRTGIVNRNVWDNSSTWVGNRPLTLVNYYVNDIAMTVLPNTPIDDTTGLPNPTIAVATDGGVSVINDDGTVMSTASASEKIKTIEFTENHGINAHIDASTDANKALVYIDEINKIDGLAYGTYANWDGVLWESRYASNVLTFLTPNAQSASYPVSDFVSMSGRTAAIGSNFSDGGLTILEKNQRDGDMGQGMVAFVTSDYNSGYQHGDIKGAFLSDTDTTNVTGSEMVTNGTFASDTSGWSVLNTGTFTASAGQATLSDSDGTGTSPVAYQAISGFVVGKTYVLSYNTTAAREAYAFMSHTAGSNNQNMFILGYTGSRTGTQNITFVANATTMIVNFNDGSGSDFDITIDNVSLRLAEEDRSVNNNGLQVYGTVTKSAVATGANLVSYGPFSTSNYLIQPYNSGLDFGTGDFSVTWWHKITGNIADTSYAFDRQGSNGYRIASYLYQSGDGSIAFYTLGSLGGLEVVASGLNSYADRWMCFTLVRTSSGFMQIYINGELKTNTFKGVSNLTNASAFLFVGIRHDESSSPADQDEMALLRFSASAPSPEQIKKIYDNEKVLFQENVQATLYGSSDAVTALAYDEVTDELHVGTSSGRSDFQGLRRINNTTTAVTTAISASDDLIAEQ